MPNYYPGSFHAPRRNPRDSRYRDMADDPTPDQAPSPAPRTQQARYRRRCVVTGATIEPGDTITYQRGVGSTLVARARVSDVFVIGGREFYRNRAGRCEDAPCCGCCTI